VSDTPAYCDLVEKKFFGSVEIFFSRHKFKFEVVKGVLHEITSAAADDKKTVSNAAV
jgi:hypothetical protein